MIRLNDHSDTTNILSRDDRRKDSLSKVRKAVAHGFEHYSSRDDLALPELQLIRAGTSAGLPFETIMTDIFLGCLPATQICYGSCFAAKGAFEAGFDYGKRVPNILNPNILLSDLETLPASQRFIRQGWNSDASWDWEKAAEITSIVAPERFIVFVTKYFKHPDSNALKKLVSGKSELRVSISAFDTRSQLKQIMEGILSYRESGGIAIPIVMTLHFKDSELNRRQDEIVEWVLENDLAGSENSLRIPPSLPVADLQDFSRSAVMAGGNDRWSGRIYPEELPIPTITALSSQYPGISSSYRSMLPRGDFLAEFTSDPVPLQSADFSRG